HSRLSLSVLPAPPRSPPFPYTTLFRSWRSRASLSVAPARTASRISSAARRAAVAPLIQQPLERRGRHRDFPFGHAAREECDAARDRKSTRLNSSHEWISYAVFCLKKKK